MTGKNQRKSKNTGSDRGQRREKKEYDQQIIDIARVTRVMAGGKRMRFRACVVIGNRQGKIGTALAKGADVTLAVNKAVAKAKNNMITIPIVNETIPHRVDIKYGAAKILIKPAPKGTGIIAGGAVRVILDLAGVANAVAKILGTNNKINNVKATFEALRRLKKAEPKAGAEKKQKIEVGEAKEVENKN